MKEKVVYKTSWRIRKFLDKAHYLKNDPFDICDFKNNALLNEGINELWTILCSSGGTLFDNANAHLGVGDDNTAAAATQTGLLGSNKYYKNVDSGYPTFGTAQKATWVATFDGSEANFAWQEFTIANGASDASVNLNRKVSNQGTKVLNQVWELSLEITLA